MKKQLTLAALTLALLLIPGCARSTPAEVTEPAASSAGAAAAPTAVEPSAVESGPYWPTQEWRSSTPEAQGMDSDKLAQMFEAIEAQRLNLHSLLVIRNGYIVTEAYFSPHQPDTRHEVQSITKSIVSALVGIAIDQGYIGSVNDPLLAYFPDRTIAHRDPRKEAVTLANLLTMTSGLAGDEAMGESRDWVQFMLDRPVVAEPGTKFHYNSGNIHLLSAIIQETSGANTWVFAYKHLFKPLGIDLSEMYWESDPNGLPAGGWGLWLRPADMAKIGYLYLNEGVWDGQQLVPAGWIRASTQPQIQVGEPLEPWDLHLGYCWWLHQPGFYGAHGMGGQFIFVIPDQKMVVVFTSALKEAEFIQPELLVRDFIMPAVISSAPLPANPAGVARLEAEIKRVEQPEAKPVPPLPPTAHIISGKTYVLASNPGHIRNFSLSFQETEALWTVHSWGTQHQYTVGLDDVFRISSNSSYPPMTEVAVKGFWQDDKTFVMNFQPIGGSLWFEYSFRFEEDKVKVHAVGSLFNIDDTFQGELQNSK